MIQDIAMSRRQSTNANNTMNNTKDLFYNQLINKLKFKQCVANIKSSKRNDCNQALCRHLSRDYISHLVESGYRIGDRRGDIVRVSWDGGDGNKQK